MKHPSNLPVLACLTLEWFSPQKASLSSPPTYLPTYTHTHTPIHPYLTLELSSKGFCSHQTA